jgi:hypothetical protein
VGSKHPRDLEVKSGNAALRAPLAWRSIIEMGNVRTCGVCGAVIATMFVNGMMVEACERHGATACPMPPVEMYHGHSEGPRGPGMPRPAYVLGTGTGGPTGPIVGNGALSAGNSSISGTGLTGP